MVFYLAVVQARWACAWRPAQWLERLARARRARCAWTLDTPRGPAAALAAVAEAAAPHGLERFLVVHRVPPPPPARAVPGGFCRLDVRPGGATLARFSPTLQFVDAVDVEAAPGAAPGTVELRAASSSANVLPAWVPLAPLLGAAICWLPAGDGGANLANLAALRRAVDAARGVRVVEERVLERGGRAGAAALALAPVPPNAAFFASYVLTTGAAVALLLVAVGAR